MTTPARRAGERGVTRFELAIGAVLFVLLAGALANRVLFYQQQAEIVAAEQLITTLRAALREKYTQALVAQNKQHLALLLVQNPISWLAQTPANYLGEYYSPDTDELADGSWYFDRNNKTLVYIVDHGKTFALKPSKLLKFKVKLIRWPPQRQQTGASDGIQGVALEQVNEIPTVSKK